MAGTGTADTGVAGDAAALAADALLPGRDDFDDDECCSRSSRASCSACSWAARSSASFIASVRAAIRRPPAPTRAARRDAGAGDEDEETAGIGTAERDSLLAGRSFDGEEAFGSRRVKTQ